MEKIQNNILLVEDDAIIALNQKRQLKKHGYTIIHVLSGEEAVETVKISEHKIDLILMDIDLGKGIDGTQAAKKILDFEGIPVVFLSSHTEPEVVEKTEVITSYGYVVKNSGITVLNASIKMAFKLFSAHKDILKHKSEAEKANKENDEFWDTLSKKKHLDTQFINKSKSGKLITVETSINPIFDNNGKIEEFVQIQRDITEQILAEEKILKSNDYLSFLSTIANEQANTNNFDTLTDLIIQQLKKISKPIFVTFSEYDSTDRLLKNLKIQETGFRV